MHAQHNYFHHLYTEYRHSLSPVSASMTNKGQSYDIPLGHGQQLFEILSRFSSAVKSYD